MKRGHFTSLYYAEQALSRRNKVLLGPIRRTQHVVCRIERVQREEDLCAKGLLLAWDQFISLLFQGSLPPYSVVSLAALNRPTVIVQVEGSGNSGPQAIVELGKVLDPTPERVGRKIRELEIGI